VNCITYEVGSNKVGRSHKIGWSYKVGSHKVASFACNISVGVLPVENRD